MNANAKVPEGYMQNSLGGLTPTKLVADIDKLRDQVVGDIVAQARSMQEKMRHFKACIFSDIDEFVKLSAEQYGAEVGGAKGNITLTSFDGTLKVEVKNQDMFSFDERLQIAKTMVDNCIKRWEQQLNSGAIDREIFGYIMAIARAAFQVDKQGKFNRANLLNLTKHNIPDEEWKRAMKAIIDAQAFIGSKLYLRVSQRGGNDQKWEHIALDLAAL